MTVTDVRDSVSGLRPGSWDLLAAHDPPSRDVCPDVTPPVLVGVDGSPASDDALEWALREARAHGAPLRVVTAWAWDARSLALPRARRPADEARERQEAQLARVLRRTGPALCRVDTVLAEGDPASLLLEESRTARLLVLGTPATRSAAHPAAHPGGHPSAHPSASSRGGVGAVARACVRFARCPVVVVPDPRRPAGRP